MHMLIIHFDWSHAVTIYAIQFVCGGRWFNLWINDRNAQCNSELSSPMTSQLYECPHFFVVLFLIPFYASAFRRWRHYVFGLSVCPSVHPKPEIPSFHLYMGPLVHPTNRDRFAAYPSIHLERFPGICRRTHGANGLKFCMLMYLDPLQNWLDYGYSLLIFAILAIFWLSETGQIWCFQAFSGEHMEGMAWNCVCWCILITFITD